MSGAETDFDQKTEPVLTSGKIFETDGQPEVDSAATQRRQEIQKLTKEIEELRVAMETAEGAYLEAKNKHDGVFQQFKSLFVAVSLGEAQKEQESLRAKLREATGAYREKLALLETGLEEIDKFDPVVKEIMAEAELEIPEAKSKKTRVRKTKPVEIENMEKEVNHFAAFQKHIAKGKAASAIKVFRKALARDVSWKEIKKLTLGQAALKFYWHEDAEIKNFLHKLKETLGDKGASVAGETLHEWTQRLSQLAIEQADGE
ncbi:MAG: hypothetical protein WC238_05545 [Parcubacteria group bacterium]